MSYVWGSTLAEYQLSEIHRLWDGHVDLKRYVVGPEKVAIWHLLLAPPNCYNGEYFYGHSAREVIKKGYYHAYWHRPVDD